MEMKTVRIYFCDFWNGFNPADNFFIAQLKPHYNVILDSSNPDFLFYSWNGSKHYSYENAVKIYFTGENDVPDFNECDYAIGFQPIVFGDRYLRMPLYVLYDCFSRLTHSRNIADDASLINRKFCSYVVSNAKAADPYREYFFKELNKYKKIDSGGKYMNNVGGPVKDKYAFIRNYKFNIAFENSKADGYTTEKLVEPLTENTLPVYWGNPLVENDFNKASFVFVNDFASADKAIEEIIRLDNDNDAYLKMLHAPALNPGQKTQKEWLEVFDAYIFSIFENKETAYRVTQYGFTRFLRNRKRILSGIYTLPGLKFIIRKLSYKI